MLEFAASCKSYNTVYLIACRRCSQQYVGETRQPLHRRINSHCFEVTQRRTEESPVAEHFNNEGHTLADKTVVVIDQLYSHHSCHSKTLESRWIRILGTSHPFGMKIRVDSLWTCSKTICGPLGILHARLIPGLLAIPRSNNYVLDTKYKYNVSDTNNVLSAQILRKAS